MAGHRVLGSRVGVLKGFLSCVDDFLKLTRASLTADGLGVFSLTSVSALTGLQLLSAALHVSRLHPISGPFVVSVRQMHRPRWLAV